MVKPVREDAPSVIRRLQLEPHPEGGYFREIYRAREVIEHPGVPDRAAARRPTATMIYYLLGEHEFSRFHRLRWTDEIWHALAGDPLELHLIDEHGRYRRQTLAVESAVESPTLVVPAGCWQAARVAQGGRWSLASCVVAPGFDFADLEMPVAGELIDRYPEHAAILRELTR